jgi:hypothetical protein
MKLRIYVILTELSLTHDKSFHQRAQTLLRLLMPPEHHIIRMCCGYMTLYINYLDPLQHCAITPSSLIPQYTHPQPNIPPSFLLPPPIQFHTHTCNTLTSHLTFLPTLPYPPLVPSTSKTQPSPNTSPSAQTNPLSSAAPQPGSPSLSSSPSSSSQPPALVPCSPASTYKPLNMSNIQM